jgi:hypothetical protein
VYDHQGERVVAGQRLMQATSDNFLGWARGADGRDYYVRQLRSLHGPTNLDEASPFNLTFVAALCGKVLARAHARSDNRFKIAGYLGASDRFDRALAEFAHAYADQTERDHAALVRAVKSGRVTAETGV